MIPIPTNDLSNFAKYEVITTTRQADGAKLIATRVIIDEKLPVRWDVEVIYPQQSSFRAPVMTITEPPSTSKLIKRAAEEGFGDWYPKLEEMVGTFPIDAAGDTSQMKLTPKYSEQDKVDYLVD